MVLTSFAVGVAALLGGVLSGCGSVKEAEARYIPPSELAEEALRSSLEAWKAGGEPGKVGLPLRRVMVADSHRRLGQSLKDYSIVGEAPLDGGRRFVVRLSFVSSDTAGEPVEDERARYLIVGIDPLWVIRQEDYDMIAHWDHPMPEETDSAEKP